MKNNYSHLLKFKINGADSYIDGWYQIPHNKINGYLYFIVVSSGQGWEHVSVSLRQQERKHIHPVTRTLTWDEMCFVKDLFWNDDEVVVQYHPAKKNYVNMHPYCLHLWKPTHDEIPVPPSIMVGV